MQQTMQEKFREVFPEAEEWQSEHQDEPCGLIDADEACMLVYEDTEKFGLVPISSLAHEPDSFNYTHWNPDGPSLWTMRKNDTVYYYEDECVKKIAEFFEVTPSGLQEYAYSNFGYRDYPVMFKKDDIRILVAPYVIN